MSEARKEEIKLQLELLAKFATPSSAVYQCKTIEEIIQLAAFVEPLLRELCIKYNKMAGWQSEGGPNTPHFRFVVMFGSSTEPTLSSSKTV